MTRQRSWTQPERELWSWTQPLCEACWPGWTGADHEPARVPGRIEVCCHCGAATDSGIYIDVDPHSPYARYRSLAR
jgi:hypothetical protein